jgi:SAM-dependent methyltransferase
MKTWPIFLKLQTSIAYGDGMGAPSVNANSSVAMAVDYIHRMRVATGKDRHALIIGPGGAAEVQQLLPVLRHPDPPSVLTAHQPEADAIQREVRDRAVVEVGDIHDMPYQTGAFGLVFASNVLEHCLAPYIALMECRRVLQEGGLGLFILPSFEGREGGVGPFHLHCLDRDVWGELLHKTGFGVADAEVQRGEDDSTAAYYHFHCVAVTPPPPHDRVLQEIITCKAT